MFSAVESDARADRTSLLPHGRKSIACPPSEWSAIRADAPQHFSSGIPPAICSTALLAVEQGKKVFCRYRISRPNRRMRRCLEACVEKQRMLPEKHLKTHCQRRKISKTGICTDCLQNRRVQFSASRRRGIENECLSRTRTAPGTRICGYWRNIEKAGYRSLDTAVVRPNAWRH